MQVKIPLLGERDIPEDKLLEVYRNILMKDRYPPLHGSLAASKESEWKAGWLRLAEGNQKVEVGRHPTLLQLRGKVHSGGAYEHSHNWGDPEALVLQDNGEHPPSYVPCSCLSHAHLLRHITKLNQNMSGCLKVSTSKFESRSATNLIATFQHSDWAWAHLFQFFLDNFEHDTWRVVTSGELEEAQRVKKFKQGGEGEDEDGDDSLFLLATSSSSMVLYIEADCPVRYIGELLDKTLTHRASKGLLTWLVIHEGVSMSSPTQRRTSAWGRVRLEGAK